MHENGWMAAVLMTPEPPVQAQALLLMMESADVLLGGKVYALGG
jgi:hypothetical protein